jgi:hypothetical protein
MRHGVAAVLVALLLCTSLFGQSPTPVTQVQTFHVKGTLTDPLGAVIPGAKVTFQSEQKSKTVATNEAGRYEADLPFGVYTMTAQRAGHRSYRRPPFRVASSASVRFDIILPVGRIVDHVVVNSSGAPVTPGEWAAALKNPLPYYGEESFSASSDDGVPFQLYIRYMRRAATDGTYTYEDEKLPYEDPVFVAYNLFSLQADHVVYNVKFRTVEAIGNVVVVNESGATQRAESMTLRIKNGQAIPLP